MDELYTVAEMTARLKVSRETLYAWMKAKIIPYVQIGGKRRFMASQVTKALKNLQMRQNQEAILNGRNYTLSDSSGTSSTANTKPLKQLKTFKKRQYKHSENLKPVRKRQTSTV